MDRTKRYLIRIGLALAVTAAALLTQTALADPSKLPGPPDHANASANAAQNNQDTVAKTMYGKVRGYVGDGRVLVWKGVPYAKPPLGDLRWMPPEEPDPWNGVRDAILPAEKCTQLITTPEWIRTGEAEGSEDCLYLDIYRPQRPAYHREQLPVYVWIHGGSNNFGAAGDYDGSVLAARSDVVVVVLQYRLGPMGWFYHPAVQTGGADPLTDSGNFGTLDHTRALEWIRDNIAAFGGDPNSVTITGESAGAHNVMNQVITPLAAGLFHRAMSQSGGMTTKTSAYARGLANTTIERVIRYKEGVDAATATARRLEMEADGSLEEYLRSTDARTFFKAIIAYGSIGTYDGIEDGMVLPGGGWIPAIRAGNYNEVPIILGVNEYETKSFMPLYGPAMKGLSMAYPGGPVPSSAYTWFSLIDVLKGNLALGDVLPTQLDMDVYEVGGYFGSRAWRAKFVDSVARELAAVQDGVYAYLFKWGGIGSGPHPFDFIYGAGHAAEISFFFGADQGLFGYPFVAANEAGRTDLQYSMMAYLAAFARTGNPNAPGSNLPVWEEWSNADGEPKVILFDANFDEALIAMDDEEVTFADVTAGLSAAIVSFPQSHQVVAKFFQWHGPW